MLIHVYAPPSRIPALCWEGCFQFPHFAVARPWNLRPSCFKAETGKTPDAYYVSGKLLEVRNDAIFPYPEKLTKQYPMCEILAPTGFAILLHLLMQAQTYRFEDLPYG